MITIQSKTRRTPVWLLCLNLLWPPGSFAASVDDFNDNAKDPSKWGADQVNGHGALTEKNQRLEYTCTSGTVDDFTSRPWVLTQFPYNADWEMQIDTFNSTSPSTTAQVDAFGIQIFSPLSVGTGLFAELYASAQGGLPPINGFFSSFDIAGTRTASANTGGLAVSNGAVRMAFNSATKVLTVLYDLDTSDGYQWVQYGSFGLAGTGGTNGNANWGLSDTNQLTAFVFGFSQGMTITSGQVFGDNFMETGGVTPSGGPSPDPIGSFQFAFPTNNALLTVIADVTGNYSGITPTDHRNYNVDVAQDEQGKLSAMGTSDGIVPAALRAVAAVAAPSSNIGKISTVNNEPTAQLKGTFTGTKDGIPSTGNGSARGPVKLQDIGGGTNGVEGTASFKAKVGDVPYVGKNEPIQLEVPASITTNLHKGWNFHLDINRKVVGGKEATVASAQLLLPNGDNITYPERTVKYSATKGYSLSFKGGTNVTMNPPKLDKKSSVSIKGLTFTQQGADWQPSGGAVKYQFLGQKGMANLTDFVSP